MPLTPEQEQRLRAVARAEGVDADALVAAAQDGKPDEPDADEGKPDKGTAPPAEAKIFQYHMPFMRVRELRAYIGLTERLDGDEMLCGEFLSAHGGALASAPPKSDTPT